jgi:hypothetical protein
MNTKEIWRIVPSIPVLIASSWGRIMVVPFYGKMPHGGSRNYGGEPTYGQWDGNRFIYVHKGKTVKVHRLVCEAFNGPPKHKQVCMHLDEDARNNKPENLKWGTQKENLNAPGFIRYCRNRTGLNSPTIKAQMKRSQTMDLFQ